MLGRLLAVSAAAIFACATFSGSIFAATDFVGKLQADLYAGQISLAASDARAQLAEAPDDTQARFALGAVEFLQAVENLGRAFYRYGLESHYRDYAGLSGLPILRLPVPQNPDPDQMTYEALRGIMADFVRDLGTAEATLSAISSDEVDLPLNIGLIRLDLNGDGEGSEDEALWQIFAVIADATRLDAEAAQKLLVDFDGSDVPWLRAYCHLLMAIAEFPLAYDWRDAFAMTLHGLFPKAGLPMSRASNDQAWLAEQNNLDARELEVAGIADLIAFVHLNHWTVVEPERLNSVLGHLQAMVRLSRENWKRILAEPDNRNEWIPNPQQTGVLLGLAVTDERVKGWRQFLDEFEAILEGTTLIPHWRFDKGINLRRFFLEPRTFDIVLMIQGSAALPYLEDGELSSEDTWSTITDLLDGNLLQYFIWFN